VDADASLKAVLTLGELAQRNGSLLSKSAPKAAGVNSGTLSPMSDWPQTEPLTAGNRQGERHEEEISAQN
jgi:hypothetical protein